MSLLIDPDGSRHTAAIGLLEVAPAWLSGDPMITRQLGSTGPTVSALLRCGFSRTPQRDSPGCASRRFRGMVLDVFQTRIHGRGGQGVVTAAELLSVAAFVEGRHAQAFPSFGSERTGAPVVSFCRIADHEIRSREPIVAPDALIILDPTLLHQVDLFNGLGPDGYLLINTSRTFGELGLAEFAAGLRPERLLTVPASELAREHLGRPMPNAVLLGGFAALSGLISLESVAVAVRERFPEKLAEGNIAGAEAAFAFVSAEMKELASA